MFLDKRPILRFFNFFRFEENFLFPFQIILQFPIPPNLRRVKVNCFIQSERGIFTIGIHRPHIVFCRQSRILCAGIMRKIIQVRVFTRR